MHNFNVLSYLTKASILENQIWFGKGPKQFKGKRKKKKEKQKMKKGVNDLF